MWGNQAAHASVAGVLPGPRFWGDIVDTCELLVDHRVDNPLYDPGRGTRLPQRCRWPSVDHGAICPYESGTAPHFLALPLLQTGMAYPGLTGRPARMFGGARIASHPPGVHLAFPLIGIPSALRTLEDGQNVHVGSSNQVVPGFQQPDHAGDTLIFVRRRDESDLTIFPVPTTGVRGSSWL